MKRILLALALTAYTAHADRKSSLRSWLPDEKITRPGTGTIHDYALIADSPEDLMKAINLVCQKDKDAFTGMCSNGRVTCLKVEQVYVDEVNERSGVVKIHFKGAADVPAYVDISDIDIVPQPEKK